MLRRAAKAILVAIVGVTLSLAGAMPASAQENIDPLADPTASAFTSRVEVEIAGTARVGEVLTAVVTADAAPQPGSYTYQWFSDEIEIEGATEPTLTVDPWFAEGRLAVVATPILDGYLADTGAARSPTTEPIAPAQPSGSLTVTLPEAPQSNAMLTAVVGGDLAPEPTYVEYTWIVDGEPLDDAWEQTLDLWYHGVEAGSDISVIAEAVSIGYEPATATSQTVTVIPEPTLHAEIVNRRDGLGIEIAGEYFIDTGRTTIEIHDDPDFGASPEPVLDPTPSVLGTVMPDGDGSFAFEGPLPDTVDSFTVQVRDADGVVLAWQSFVLVGIEEPIEDPTAGVAPAATNDDRLAESGDDAPILGVLLGGITLIAAGAVSLRRTRASASLR